MLRVPYDGNNPLEPELGNTSVGKRIKLTRERTAVHPGFIVYRGISMTQLQAARKGIVTREMKFVAGNEVLNVEFIQKGL